MAVPAEVKPIPTLQKTFPDFRKAFRYSSKPKLYPKIISNPSKRSLLSKTKLPKQPNRTPNRNPTDSQLSNLCSNDELELSLKNLELLLELNAEVEEDNLLYTIRLCELRRNRDCCLRIWRIVLKVSSCISDVRIGNSLLSMFVKIGDLGYAWKVFGRMTERNLFSWNILIGAYAKLGYSDEALSLYHRLLWIGIKPDVYTFPCILRTCGASKDIARGKEVHCHVLRFGFGQNVDVSNALITMYTKCENPQMACKVFDQMPARDKISWNAMISCHIENQQYLEGLQLFQAMRSADVDPDVMTMTSVISACEKLKGENFGRVLQAHVVKAGFMGDVSVCNSLIQFLSSVGKREDGEAIFERMLHKDVVTWTIMIGRRENSPERALEVYRSMESSRVRPDEIAMTTLISQCATSADIEMATTLHEAADRYGLTSSTLVANSLIEMYSKCNATDKAMKIFYSLRTKDVVTWTTMIIGLRQSNKCFKAVKMFQRMKRTSPANAVTLVSVLSACGKIGALTGGKEIHAHAIRAGISREGFLPNAILDLYVKCGRMALAENHFMLEGQRDAATWNTMLTGYAQRSDGISAVKLFHRMVAAGVSPDDVTMLALLRACSRRGFVDEGLDYFTTMEERFGVVPNVKHHACVVDLLGRVGMVFDAYEFVLKMEIEPDVAVWGALLNSCLLYGNYEIGKIAARRIYEENVESIGYYSLLCNFHVACGEWDEVAKLRKMMKEKGCATDDRGCSWVEVKGNVHAFLSNDRSHPRIGEIGDVLRQFHGDKAAGDDSFCGHSERLAVAFGLISTSPGTPIRVTKSNVYTCRSCHDIIKFISGNVRREITVRDDYHFHRFVNGDCSCGDY